MREKMVEVVVVDRLVDFMVILRIPFIGSRSFVLFKSKVDYFNRIELIDFDRFFHFDRARECYCV